MIIFGLSVFYIFGLIGTGRFHCPNCGGDRDYEHRVARRFFTLFFIPVIPLNKVGEAVRCKTCGTRFDPAVLSRPTSAQLAAALTVGMRVVASAILRFGGTSDQAESAAVEAVRRAGLTTYDLEQLRADMSQPVEAATGPLQALAAQLTPQACERFLAEGVRIAIADGPLTSAERDGIRWLAGNLAMTPAHAEGVITTVERAVTPE